MRTRFILQGLNQFDDHIACFERVFSLEPINRGLVATAFMNAAGANLLADVIGELGYVFDNIADYIDIYVGIRNGVTSKQALETLMHCGIFPYVVDTASQAFIFHPKVYLANNITDARLMVGSANATSGGMAKNVEASLYSELSMKDDLELVNSVYSQFNTLREQFPENVFRICIADIDMLAEQGLLIDESQVSWVGKSRTSAGDRKDTRPRMNLKTRSIPKPDRIRHSSDDSIPVEGTDLYVFTETNNNLLWKSGKLKRRDLNIPTSENTNPTGSMLFKKGDASQDIDQRVYFRRTVFGNQNWVHDQNPNTAHYERCVCKFRLVIKGIDYGVFPLRLSHNSRTDTKTFAQRNSMTQIHWGNALPYIAREDLLDSVCRLYAPGDDGVYTLVFDEE